MTPKQHKRAAELAAQFVSLQHELSGMGLARTAAALGVVTERIGWELAEKRQQDGLFSPEHRRREQRHQRFLAANPHLAREQTS